MESDLKQSIDYINELTKTDLSPIATPKHLAAMMNLLLQRFEAQLKEIRNNHAAGVKTEWATLTQLAKIFGVSRRTMDRIIPELMRLYPIRVIQMKDYLGSKGHRRFRIEDVEKALQHQAAA